MGTKEAIEFLKKIKNLELYSDMGYIFEADEIIGLLQRGEKFEKMWGEVETLFTSRSDRQGGEWLGNNILRNMEDIMQKYFPKEK